MKSYSAQIPFVLAGAVCALAVWAMPVAQAQNTKNVILMISDGQGFNTVRATDLFTGETPVYQGDTWVKLAMQTYSASGMSPYNSAAMFNGVDTSFAQSNYTDSASAASAMYTGVKIYDGQVNVAPDGTPLTTYFEMAAQNGRSIGAVSSVQVSHATPAAVYGHNSSRNNYAALGYEGVYGSNPVNDLPNNYGDATGSHLAGDNNNYDSLNYYDNLRVLMGAGSGDHDNNGALIDKSDKYVGGQDTWTDVKDPTPPNGWTLVREKADFEAVANGTSTPNKLLGIANVNSTLQQSRDAGAPQNTNVPTLETMTKAAMNVLSTDSDGFAVMIEGGAVDWAGHANQIDRMIEEQVDFNKSVEAVWDFVNQSGDDITWDNTLLIVTADHETGDLWGDGSYTDVNGDGDYDEGIDIFHGYQPIDELFDGAGELDPNDVQFLSGSHTNALVPLYAYGAGSEMFANYIVGYEDIWQHYGDDTAGFDPGDIGYIG